MKKTNLFEESVAGKAFCPKCHELFFTRISIKKNVGFVYDPMCCKKCILEMYVEKNNIHTTS